MRGLTCLIVLLFWAHAVQAQSPDSPRSAVEQATSFVLEVLESNSDRMELDSLLTKIESKLDKCRCFDFEHMTQLAVGWYWSQATDEQRKQIRESFTTVFLRDYAGVLATSVLANRTEIDFPKAESKPQWLGVPPQTHVILKAVLKHNEQANWPPREDVEANSTPQNDGGANSKPEKHKDANSLTIHYLVERAPEGWKIYDIVVDNVSLVTLHRSKFIEQVTMTGTTGGSMDMPCEGGPLKDRGLCLTDNDKEYLKNNLVNFLLGSARFSADRRWSSGSGNDLVTTPDGFQTRETGSTVVFGWVDKPILRDLRFLMRGGDGIKEYRRMKKTKDPIRTYLLDAFTVYAKVTYGSTLTLNQYTGDITRNERKTTPEVGIAYKLNLDSFGTPFKD